MPAFGGVAKVKNLFALPEDARAARHHMVSLMVTVLFDPDVTFGELVRDKTVREAWEAHRHRPDGEPKGRWEKIIDRAVDYMSQPSLADTNVRLLSEIQIIPSRFRDVREEMHEVYRIDRASDGQALWLDVHRVVTANIRANDATTGAGPVMVIHKAEAPTTVYLAARAGHADVVESLLASNHDPNDRRAGDRNTALSVAADSRACRRGGCAAATWCCKSQT